MEKSGVGSDAPQSFPLRLYLTLSSPPIVPRRNPSSASNNGFNLELAILDSAPSSPKRNAAFSLPGPEFGRLPDFKNGDEGFGGEDFRVELECVSGSSIQLKDLLDKISSVLRNP